ncbi:DUF4129 domain-containing protein [Kitasatospora sp. NPDC089797]|uniref:DUF4129 domain-containing protein n=1 Tax=Kitasatospora sp. NPDC089797 TaxID=3155298 RepID=UPI00341CE724
MSDGSPSGTTRGGRGRLAGVLVVVVGLCIAAATLRPEGGLLGTATAGPVNGVGVVVLLGLAWAVLVGRFALRFREEVRHLDGPTPRAERLRSAAALLLPVAAGAVPVLLLVLRSRADRRPMAVERPPMPDVTFSPVPTTEPLVGPPPSTVGLGVGVLIAGIVTLAAVAAVVLVVLGLLRWRRLRTPQEPPVPAAVVGAASPEAALAEAVASGRRALAGTDARAAVIACYAAMEGSLADSGLPRHPWESPTDLLSRLLSDERIDAAAARELTALFREARYSTHRMDDGQVRRARTALDAIAARLAEARARETTGAQAGGGAR